MSWQVQMSKSVHMGATQEMSKSVHMGATQEMRERCVDGKI